MSLDTSPNLCSAITPGSNVRPGDAQHRRVFLVKKGRCNLGSTCAFLHSGKEQTGDDKKENSTLWTGTRSCGTSSCSDFFEGCNIMVKEKIQNLGTSWASLSVHVGPFVEGTQQEISIV